MKQDADSKGTPAPIQVTATAIHVAGGGEEGKINTSQTISTFVKDRLFPAEGVSIAAKGKENSDMHFVHKER